MQQLPKMHKIRISEQQQPILVASEQYELNSLRDLPESFLLFFALDGGQLDETTRSNTLCSPSPLAELSTLHQQGPAPPTTQSTKFKSTFTKITKADLIAHGISPPSRLALLTSTPKKSTKTHSRSQSAIPPSTPQHCTAKCAASAQPTTPATAAEAFQRMGTVDPASPLRAIEWMVGINIKGDWDAQGASSGPFKVGGLTKEEQEFVQQMAEEVMAKLNTASSSINRPIDMFISFLNKLVSNKVTYARSLWNYYTSYFWHHVKEEQARINNPDGQRKCI
jgi:hypothetical protein